MSNLSSGSETIADRIAAIIQEQHLQPGDRLPSIRELADTLGEKANAVRDSLLVAQAQGIVRVLPRAGAFVTPSGASSEPGPSTSDQRKSLPLAGSSTTPGSTAPRHPNLFHLLDARGTVEVELALRAAKRRRLEDLEPIRRTLEEMAEIPELERRANYVDLDIRFHCQIARLGGNDVLADFADGLLQQLRPQLKRLPWTHERRQRTDASHLAIYRSLIDGDEDAVRKEMSVHLRAAYDSLLHQLCTPPTVAVEPLAGDPLPEERVNGTSTPS